MKHITSSILAVVVGAIAPLGIGGESIAQQETPLIGQSGSCSDSLLAAQARLKEGRDISVSTHTWDVSRAYSDYPTGQPDAYSFSMSGSAVDSVMNSPQFLTSIAADIIPACETASIVQFGAADSGWVNTFGLMEDDSVELFQCQEPGTSISRVWGNIGCT